MNYAINLSQNNYLAPAEWPVIGSIFSIFPEYKKFKIYFTPQTFASNVALNRRFSFSQARSAGTPSVSMDFTATRNATMVWKMTDGGLLNLSMNYSADVSSSLAHLLTEYRNGISVQRDETSIWADILSGQFFGKDNRFSQSFNLRTSPKLPSLWGISEYINLSLSYGTSYNWQYTVASGEQGRASGWTNEISAGMRIRKIVLIKIRKIKNYTKLLKISADNLLRKSI